MKNKVIALLLGLMMTPVFAQNEASSEPKLIAVMLIHKKLSLYDKNRRNIETIYSIVDMLKYSDDPHNSDEVSTLEDLVPAISYITKSYDEKIVPILFDYAVKEENVFLKRRAVYCIEKITGFSITDFLVKYYDQQLSHPIAKSLTDASRYGKKKNDVFEEMMAMIAFFFPHAGAENDNFLEAFK